MPLVLKITLLYDSQVKKKDICIAITQEIILCEQGDFSSAFYGGENGPHS